MELGRDQAYYSASSGEQITPTSNVIGKRSWSAAPLSVHAIGIGFTTYWRTNHSANSNGGRRSAIRRCTPPLVEHGDDSRGNRHITEGVPEVRVAR